MAASHTFSGGRITQVQKCGAKEAALSIKLLLKRVHGLKSEVVANLSAAASVLEQYPSKRQSEPETISSPHKKSKESKVVRSKDSAEGKKRKRDKTEKSLHNSEEVEEASDFPPAKSGEKTPKKKKRRKSSTAAPES
mmetsp:Transcript_29247/g.69794  ORF Transcript_29247/g.69794 Transcript_29247/m.69794 type:complete len:137 (+) Transcript_29247:241-651(+)